MLRLTQTAEPAAKPVKRFSQRQIQKPKCALLIKQTAAGDQSAFAELYDRTSGLLFGLLLRILCHRTTAEDVLVQIYLEIWQQAISFDEDRETSLTWLIIIARRKALVRLHKNIDDQLNVFCGNENLVPSAFGWETSISEQEHLVRSVVGALSLGQREMIELSYFSGMKESAIAEYLGLQEETVNLSLRLAMKKLSNLFRFLDSSPETEKNYRNTFQ